MRGVIRKPKIETKVLTEIDVPLVAKWNIQLHEDEASTPMTVEAAENRHLRWLKDETFQGALFLINQEPIGYIIFEHRPVDPDLRASESVYVRQFFICRESRRKNYGTTAFNTFLNRYVPLTANVLLNVKSSNPVGQKFWESLDFNPENIEYEFVR